MLNWTKDRQRQRGMYPGQREALTWRSEGMSNSSIADTMGLSKRTVVSYLCGAKSYLGVATIDEAVNAAQQQDLIPFYRDGDRP